MLKNPIILGILTGVLIYAFLYWQEERKYKKDQNYKKNVNFLIPGITAALVWFMAGSYFDNNEKVSKLPKNSIIHKLDENVLISESNNSDSKSYRLIGKGKIELPEQEVFLNLANF